MRAAATLVLLLAPPALAQEPALTFIAHTTDAVLPAARLVKFDDGAVELGQTVSIGNLVELRQQGRVRPALPQANFIALTHGDFLALRPGASIRLVDGRLVVTPRSAQADRTSELSLFKPYLTFFFIALPEPVENADRFVAKLRQETRPRDVVYLRDGDRVEGTVTALDPIGGVIVTDDERTITVAWAKLAGVAWATERQTRPRLRKLVGHAVLADGGRLRLTQLRFDDDAQRWTGTTWFGAELRFPADALVALDIWHGPVTALSDLKPLRYEHTPFLGVAWDLGRDAALDGGCLRLGGSV